MAPSSTVICLLACLGAVFGMSIDEIIMDAAPKMSMLDVVQMSADGEVFVTLGLDIRLSVKEYQEYFQNPEVTRSKRKAVQSTERRWSSQTVYYEFEPNYFSLQDTRVITSALDEWASHTCLKFLPAVANVPDKIVFGRGTGGCYSRLGKIGGPQEIGLSRGCIQKGVVIHEVGHAIGWIHEQARPDRDSYIRVNFNRIPREWHPQFDKFPPQFIKEYRVQYDYESIMHYSGNALAPRTIETLNPAYQNVIGQRLGFSFRDVMLANLMYDCPAVTCPGVNSDCSQFGTDAFLYKLSNTCRCVCKGGSQGPLLVPCTTNFTTQPTTVAPLTMSPSLESTTVTMECKDLGSDCKERVLNGMCRLDVVRMMTYCRKSCDFCDKVMPDQCTDSDSSCPLLALARFCNNTAFHSIMQVKCRRSCFFCKPVDACELQKQLGLSPVLSSGGSAIVSPIVRDTAWPTLLFISTTLLQHALCHRMLS